MPTTKIPPPTQITILWKDGTRSRIATNLVGHGAARDVVGGASEWVLKIQDAKWHDTSNAHEYRMGTTIAKDFVPKMAGCVKCAYETR